mgnify:CR=1 FL=1
MSGEQKTNVMRLLEQAGVAYRAHFCPDRTAVNGVQVAALLGLDAAAVFKTLVTVGKSGANYVFVIPVAKELDLRKAARAAGEKSVEMLPAKQLLSLTGYVHGGCSPIGMKKRFPTFVDESAVSLPKMFFSAGKIGIQVELCPAELLRLLPCRSAGLTD